MGFVLGFNVSDYNKGKTLLISDNSTNWDDMNESVTHVVISITSMYEGVELQEEVIEVEIPIEVVDFEEGFAYEITAEDLFGESYTGTVKDSIYHITMQLYTSGGLIETDGFFFESSEVYYFNALTYVDKYIAKVALDRELKDHRSTREAANWLDFLIVGIESNTRRGNTGAIYRIFDTFNALSDDI